ncbi:hypothetical protein [Streptomyces sp. SD15]
MTVLAAPQVLGYSVSKADRNPWPQPLAPRERHPPRAAAHPVPDGFTTTDPRPESETEARIEGMQRLIGRIREAEARSEIP